MPYEAKLSRDAKEWMTLGQVVAHVASAEACQPETALSQILFALQDEEIPIKWAADPPSIGQPLHRDLLFAFDDPPTGRFFWSTATILPAADYSVLDHPIQFHDIEGDEIREPFSNPSRGLRTLLLLRAQVQRFWPSSNQENSLTKYGNKKTRASNDAIRTEARILYRDHDPKPNITMAEKLIRRAIPSARRTSTRSVLSEPEFATQRRPAGNSKTKR